MYVYKMNTVVAISILSNVILLASAENV
jgi:hypothetical protein